MYWIKHKHDYTQQPKIAALLSKWSWAGYGRSWRLMEIVSKQFEVDDPIPAADFPLRYWRKELGFSGNRKCLEFLSSLDSLEFANVMGLDSIQTDSIGTSSSTQIRIEVPELLHLRDNHTKNQQAKGQPLGRRVRDKAEIQSLPLEGERKRPKAINGTEPERRNDQCAPIGTQGSPAPDILPNHADLEAVLVAYCTGMEFEPWDHSDRERGLLIQLWIRSHGNIAKIRTAAARYRVVSSGWTRGGTATLNDFANKFQELSATAQRNPSRTEPCPRHPGMGKAGCMYCREEKYDQDSRKTGNRNG